MSTIQQLRAPKIEGIAIFDLLATALIPIIFGVVKQYDASYIFVLFILLMIFAIGIHYAIKMPTMLNYYLGLNTLDEVKEGRRSRGEIV